MPQSGVSVPQGEAWSGEPWRERPPRRRILEADSETPVPRPDLPTGTGIPGRRTVTISGRGHDRTAGVTRRDGAARRRSRPAYERHGFKPDRAAMWAVLLCLVLVLVAATSSHAAILTTLAH